MYQLTNTTSIRRIADGASIPNDPANTDYANYLDWVVKGNTPEPVTPPTAEQITATLTTAIQQRLDDFAKARNYDSILSACTYATSTVPKFASEGQACVNLRDATWAKTYDILAQVQVGTRPMPQSIADIEAELPALVWP